MAEAYYPSTIELMQRQRNSRVLVWALLIATVVVVFGAMGALMHFTNATGGKAAAMGFGLFLCMAVPVLVWQYPRVGLYLVLATTVLEVSGPWLGNVPLLGIPMWFNISSIGDSLGTHALDPVMFSPGEIIFILAAVSWIIRAIALRRFHPVGGEFFWWIAAYLAVVAEGWVYGVTTGGDKIAALREVRAQFHFFGAYLLAANLLQETKHVRPVIWIAAIGIGICGLVGSITYLGNPGASSVEGLPGLSHANSLQFNIALFICFLMLITRADRKLAAASCVLAIPALVAALANQRRAGIASFIVAFIPLLPLLWVAFKDRRKQIATFAVVFGIVAGIYLPLAWNATGPWALPARAIRSNTDPNMRDAMSNVYRDNENYDLLFSRNLRPWLGMGYGKPFAQIIPLPAVSTDILFFTPHNGVLWVWMRLGHLGFLMFIMMFAAILIKGTHIVRDVGDPFLKVAGILAMLLMLMIFIYGKYDLQLIDPAQMNFAGILVGILGALRITDRRQKLVERAEAENGEAPEEDVRVPEPSAV